MDAIIIMSKQSSVDSLIPLNGAERVATILLSLSEEQASKIFLLFTEDEIKAVSQAMSSLGKTDSKSVESLFINFIQEMGASGGSVIGSFDSTERLLAKSLPPDKVSSIMEEIRGPAGRNIWEKLGNVSEEILANYLKNEYPQTIAVILSRMKPERAARVAGILPEPLAMDVILRMLKMESVQKEVLDDIEKTLKTEFMTSVTRASKRDPFEVVAEMFNHFDRATETQFMGGLESRNTEIAERVKGLMFTFDDLIRIDNMGIQVVLRVVDKQKLALALKGANEKIRSLFFDNMSERAAKLLRDDMDGLGMVRVKDVDEAQAYLVNTAKDLAGRGEIEINRGDENEQLIG